MDRCKILAKVITHISRTKISRTAASPRNTSNVYFFFPQCTADHEPPSERSRTERAGRSGSANQDCTGETTVLVSLRKSQREAKNRDVAATNTEEQVDPEIASAAGHIQDYSPIHSGTSLSGHSLYRHSTFIIKINFYVLGIFISIPLDSALDNPKVSNLSIDSLPIVMGRCSFWEERVKKRQQLWRMWRTWRRICILDIP